MNRTLMKQRVCRHAGMTKILRIRQKLDTVNTDKFFKTDNYLNEDEYNVSF